MVDTMNISSELENAKKLLCELIAFIAYTSDIGEQTTLELQDAVEYVFQKLKYNLEEA